MKAFLFYEPEKIQLEEVSPEELAHGELRVKIQSSVTGGTDLKTYLRGHPRIITKTPSKFGYEFAGTVIESKSPKFKIGDRVISANTAPCYECYFCDKKEFELCENLEFLNGSFSEEIIIPAQITKHNTYKIHESISFDKAVLTQTLAVALHGFYKSGIKDGDKVCVYGIGAIGQCFIKLCKAFKKNIEVFAVGSSNLKLELAKKNKADYVINYKKTKVAEYISERTDYGCDVVIEAVGKPEAWEMALKLVRPGGLVNFFGGCPKGSSIEIDTFQAHYLELRTVGVFHHTPHYIQEALRIISENKIDLSDLVTDTMPLSELETALKKMNAGEAIKVLIKP
jgi:L-iditol 2-dehydrogenase